MASKDDIKRLVQVTKDPDASAQEREAASAELRQLASTASIRGSRETRIAGVERRS